MGIHYSKKVYNVVFEEILSVIEEEKEAEKLSEEEKTEKKAKVKQDKKAKR